MVADGGLDAVGGPRAGVERAGRVGLDGGDGVLGGEAAEARAAALGDRERAAEAVKGRRGDEDGGSSRLSRLAAQNAIAAIQANPPDPLQSGPRSADRIEAAFGDHLEPEPRNRSVSLGNRPARMSRPARLARMGIAVDGLEVPAGDQMIQIASITLSPCPDVSSARSMRMESPPPPGFLRDDAGPSRPSTAASAAAAASTSTSTSTSTSDSDSSSDSSSSSSSSSSDSISSTSTSSTSSNASDSEPTSPMPRSHSQTSLVASSSSSSLNHHADGTAATGAAHDDAAADEALLLPQKKLVPSLMELSARSVIGYTNPEDRRVTLERLAEYIPHRVYDYLSAGILKSCAHCKGPWLRESLTRVQLVNYLGYRSVPKQMRFCSETCSRAGNVKYPAFQVHIHRATSSPAVPHIGRHASLAAIAQGAPAAIGHHASSAEDIRVRISQDVLLADLEDDLNDADDADEDGGSLGPDDMDGFFGSDDMGASFMSMTHSVRSPKSNPRSARRSNALCQAIEKAIRG